MTVNHLLSGSNPETGAIAPSSRGRTADFDSANCGSNPRGATNLGEVERNVVRAQTVTLRYWMQVPAISPKLVRHNISVWESLVNPAALEAADRRFKSYHTDHLLPKEI